MKDTAYQQVLAEFRADIFQRFSLIIAIGSLITGFAVVFVEPLPHQLVLTLQLFCGFVLVIRHIGRQHPDIARYLFVSSLYIMLAMVMVLVKASWLPFLVAPFLFVSELLAARVTILAGLLLVCYAGALTQWGVAAYPLPALVFFTIFVFVLSKGGLRTIWILLHWYRSMFDRSNSLLEEARTHRAELTQTLKSLEIAQDTQQRLQTQLIYARQQAEEARQMKERFASNISHELRTPLNIILGFTELMHLTPEVYGSLYFPPKLQQDIYQIHRNSRHLLDMIDDVLDLSHIELSQFSLNFERTDLKLFLQDTVNLVSNLFRDKPVEFIVSIAEGLPEIQIDRTRIRQVLINLITNAQRFTMRGSVTLCVSADEKEVKFQVADTGIGIPQQQIHLIFEEFFQVDYSLSRANGGAGLGLAITRRFVEAHEGRLQVESEEGVGSIFTFTLPVPPPSPTSGVHLQNSSEIGHESTWLVVEEDPQVSKLIRRYVDKCSIIQVNSLERLSGALGRYSPQGVIINMFPEVSLPTELSNLSIPVVLCSLPSTSQMARKLGVAACLAKPMLPQEIVEHIGKFGSIKTILVIDDDVGVVQLVQRALEGQYADLVIWRAYDGQQACEKMKTSVPDLVLLDLVMPTMSGFEVIDAMKDDTRLQNIPIVLLTATKYIYADDETHGDLHLHVAGGLKPVEVLKLLNLITQTIDS